MTYTIKFLKRAERHFKKLPKDAQRCLSDKIDALAQDPRPPRAKMLSFEPWLLGSIELSEFNTVRRYLQHCITVYPTLGSVKKTVKDNRPLTLSGSVREAFKIDVDKAEQVTDLMELYLRRFGKENFERIFPLPHI